MAGEPGGFSGQRSFVDGGERHSRGVGGGGGTRPMPLWQEMPLLLFIAFCLAVLIRTFLLQAFFIPSGSMEDTLLVGDRVLVNKVVYDLRTPERGEVVVFRGPDNWRQESPPDTDIGFFAKLSRTMGDLVGISRPGDKDFIKRVVGLPGDRVSCCDVQGRVFVNGMPLDEPYVTRNSLLAPPPNAKECRSRRFEEVVIGKGNMFVMGDHRAISSDSRCQGQVPIANLIGRAFVIVWPSGRWGALPVPSTFDNVPAPLATGPARAGAAGARPVVSGPVISGPAPQGDDPPRSATVGLAAGPPPMPAGVPMTGILPILWTLPLTARSRSSFAGMRRRLPE